MGLITWNPNDLGSGSTLDSTLLVLNISKHSGGSRATIPITQGKYYFEININSIVSNLDLGISNLIYTFSSDIATDTKNVCVTRESSVGSIGIAVDLINHSVKFYRNGNLKISKTIPVSLQGKEVYPIVRSSTSDGVRLITANFGSSEFNIINSNLDEWINLQNDGYQPYDMKNADWFYIKKHLIKSNNIIYYLNEENVWQEIELQEPLTKENFEMYGMNNLDRINDEKLQELYGEEFEIITWTNDPSEEVSYQLEGSQDTTWSEEGKLFEIVVDEDKKIKAISSFDIL